ncbi:MAG: hypothetical protein QM811_13675 [Pirellulales bacterium]
MEYLYWIGGGMSLGGVLAVVGYYLCWIPSRNRRREGDLERALREFHLRREQLEAKFLSKAAATGKPRGLRWVDCDFQNEITYARDKRTGSISAFVGVTISFEAIEGGGMEDVEAVGNLRAATAVFSLDEGLQWRTDGRAIFNLNPVEAIRFYQANLEPVATQHT